MNTPLQRLFLAACSILLVTSILFSQNSASTDSSNNSLQKGRFSLQFGIGQNLTINAFNGYTISCGYNLTDHISARFGIEGSYRNNTVNVTWDDTLSRDEYDFGYSFTVDPSLIYHFNHKATIVFFAGAGPFISYSHSKTKGAYDYYQLDLTTTDSWEAGAKFLAGCEWFFMKRVSLFADYEASYSFGKRDRDSKRYDYENGYILHYQNNEVLNYFRADIFRFGLSVFF